MEIAIFLRETGEKTFAVSLRSKEYADVAKLAMQFQGGGHVHAAGCTAPGQPGGSSGERLLGGGSPVIGTKVYEWND